MMIFSKYFIFFAAGLLALLQSTLARPYPLFDDGLIERETSEDTLFKREFTDIDARNNLFSRFPELERRAGRGQTGKGVGGSKSGTVAQKRQQVKGPPKYSLGPDARKELDGLGLHGKARKSTVKWHKNQVKQQMKTNPMLKGAQNAVIKHIAHKGGSDPKEPLHITASFQGKNKKDITNSFNGGTNHHLYVSEKGLPRQAKTALDKNNAVIKGQSHEHQVSVSKTRSDGKSSDKGKGKQNPDRNFSKNPAKGFQRGK